MLRGPIALSAGSLSGDGVIAEGAIEFLVQQHSFLPEGGLVTQDVSHCNRAVYETAAPHNLRAAAIGVKGQGAAGIRRACSFTIR